jgi:hypothetical protein
VPLGNGSWQRITEQPEGRVMQIDLAGHHKDYAPVEVRQANGWTAHDGKHYAAGEVAPMLRVFYHLAGRYEYLVRGIPTRRVKWEPEDYEFWFNLYHRRALPVDIKTQVAWRDKLMDLNHKHYGIGSTSRPEPGRSNRAEDVWPK